MFSTDIGIISHYLSDYTCLAHAKDWAMPKNTVKHLRYESDLGELAKEHKFNKEIIEVSDIRPETRLRSNLSSVKSYVGDVIDEYLESEHTMEKDLDYALSINISVVEHIVESILTYEYEEERIFTPKTREILV